MRQYTSNITQQMWISVCAALGLACMFGGIWLGDAQVMDQLGNALSTFVMRIFSVLVYVVFLGIAIWFAKRRQGGLRAFFGVTSIIAVVFFFVGIILIFVVFPSDSLSGTGKWIIGWTAFLFTKFIGAPVSVGLVCVFGQLERERSIRMATLGMLGTFIIYSFGQQAVMAGALSEENAMFVSVLLLGLSCVFGMMGMSDQVKTDANLTPSDIVASGVVRRPMKQIITPGFLMMALFSAIMLGYLRSGYQATDPHMNPISVVALIALIAIAAIWKGLRLEHVFYGALILSAAGILLYPVLDSISPNTAGIVTAMGTALFEVIMWSLAVWAARNSFEMLVSAGVARLTSVLGHFVGTFVVLVGVMVSKNPTDASHASGLIIVFIYMVMLIVLIRKPSLQAPFMGSPEEAGTLSAAPIHNHENLSAAAASASGAACEEEENVADRTALLDKEYWEEPCRTIAATYQLTTREYDVLEQLARGYNLAAMEENLVISHNTMKMHMRHIYTKLDVHSRQDVINMVEQVRSQS